MAKTFQGKRVSSAWFWILTAADLDIDFRLNSGRRTMAEQRGLVAIKGVWSPSNTTGAASPNINAPHIWLGRPNHALDVDTNVSAGEAKLQIWLASHGVQAVNNVPGEPWHLFVPNVIAFLKLARKCKKRVKSRRKKRY